MMLNEELEKDFDRFVGFCVEHGGALRNHRAFGEMAADIRARLRPTVKLDLTIDYSTDDEFFDAVGKHLEAFAAAYLKATNIPPQDAMFVVQTSQDKVTFHFERRPHGS